MYHYQHRIGYSDLGSTGTISPGTVVDYFQDCSTFQAESLGVGVSLLETVHRAWIMAYWQIEFLRFPRMEEVVDIATYPYKLKGPFGYRCFSLKGKEGELLARADSLWVFMDMEKGIMVRTPKEVADAFKLDQRMDMEKRNHKVKMPEDLEEQPPFRVRKSDIDTNGHVNNAVYVKLSQEFIPDGMVARSLRAEYKNSAMFGERIVPFVKQEDGVLYVELCSEDGKAFTAMEFGLEKSGC